MSAVPKVETAFGLVDWRGNEFCPGDHVFWAHKTGGMLECEVLRITDKTVRVRVLQSSWASSPSVGYERSVPRYLALTKV